MKPPHDRALRRAFKLRGKLGGDGGIGDYVSKPKWMRWPTYDRKLEEIFAAEEVVDAHLLAFVQNSIAVWDDDLASLFSVRVRSAAWATRRRRGRSPDCSLDEVERVASWICARDPRPTGVCLAHPRQ